MPNRLGSVENELNQFSRTSVESNTLASKTKMAASYSGIDMIEKMLEDAGFNPDTGENVTGLKVRIEPPSHPKNPEIEFVDDLEALKNSMFEPRIEEEGSS